MSFHGFDQKDFDKWKRGIAHDCHLPGWNLHDTSIRNAVAAFDRFNQGRSGYVGPRWQLIKAVLWVEGGGPSFPDWKSQPMQIAWLTDPGILDVLHHPWIEVVTPPEVRRNFGMASIKTVPEVNIQAGLSLLHLKLAVMGHRLKASKPIDRPMPGATKPPAAPGGFSSRPPVHGPHAMEPCVQAWLPFCPVTLYQRYNVGDGAYARKLEYAMELISS